LEPDEAVRLLRTAIDAGAEAIAVSLLFSYANPEVEQAFATALAEVEPALFLSLSSEVSPEYREVERTATTALNSYVGPVMSRYLHGLGRTLKDRGVPALHVVQSDGGAASVEQAARRPVTTLLSGPSAGVLGAFEVAR